MTNSDSTPPERHHRLLLWDILRDKRSRSIGIWVVILLIIGATFYHYIEGWSWIDSIYFCFISLATVGYGDFAPTTDLSKIFTIFYIANGIGVLISFFDIFASLRLRRPVNVAK